MLFDSSLRKELSRSFGATLVVILTIVVTMMLIRALAQAAGGRVAPQDVLLLLAYTALGQLPMILSLSLFVAVVSTLTRMYRDSEMAIWFASGVSLMRFLPVALRFALPLVVCLAALSVLLGPWATRQMINLRDSYENRSDLSRVAPGQFESSSNGQRVFFVDKDSSETGEGRHIFILDKRADSESVTTAQAGRIEPGGAGQRVLILENGARTELDQRTGRKSLARFDEYRIVIGEKSLAPVEEQPLRARSSLDLLKLSGRRVDAEWAARIGPVLTAVNLLLLGIGLSSGNQRKGASWTLLFALLSFVVYFNLVNLSQAWVASGQLSLAGALLAVHGSVFVIGTWLLWWRERGSSWRLRRTPAPSATPLRA
jgi:lipopolysaccharide export system permease protein